MMNDQLRGRDGAARHGALTDDPAAVPDPSSAPPSSDPHSPASAFVFHTLQDLSITIHMQIAEQVFASLAARPIA